MGTSKNGLPPFSPSDIQPRAGVDTFGSGGANVAPNQGIPAMGAVLLDLLKRIASPVANTAALQATVQADRADGQMIVTLDTYTIWLWQNGSNAAASATVIEPTDIAGGAHGGLGRYVAYAGIGG